MIASVGIPSLLAVEPTQRSFTVQPSGQIRKVKVWDLATGQELRSWDANTPDIERGSFIAAIAFSPDGKHLVTGNANSTLFLLDLP